MNPFELRHDSSEVGNMVGTCVPLAPSASAGAIIGAIVDAVIGEFVGAGVATMLMTIHNPISAAVHTTRLTSHYPNLDHPDRQQEANGLTQRQHMDNGIRVLSKDQKPGLSAGRCRFATF